MRRPEGGLADEIRLTNDAWECGTPDWSPDGRTLLYTGWERGGAPGMSFAWTVSLDPATGKPGRVAKLRLPSSIPGAETAAYSPRGDEIAVEAEASPGHHALWIVRADGSNAREIVEYPMESYGGVDWTPDGGSIVYAALAGDRMQVFAIPARGGEARQLTKDERHVFQPQVSPDGKWIAATRMLQTKRIWRRPLD